MKKDSLKNKKVLLLTPYFFGYETKIVRKLEELGAAVICINDDPTDFYSTLIDAFRHFHLPYSNLIRRFENSVQKKVGNERFDFILVVNGWAITKRFVSFLKNERLNTNGKMFLYYWDSLCVLRDDPERRSCFELINTFDTEDYRKNDDMGFVPLFYCDEYIDDGQVVKPEYDLATVGSYKYNRYFEIERIKTNNKTIKVNSVLYATKMVKVHKALRKKYKDIDIHTFVYEKLSFQEIIDIFKRSRAILDIPIAGQNGLTMRTFECLAMKKKIVTTNENIKLYDFYDPRYIFVLNRNDYKLPPHSWFETEGYIDDEVIKKYSIGSWLNSVIGIDHNTYLLEDT